jgi:hypothetical protein
MVAPLLPAGLVVNPDYPNEHAVVVFLGERPAGGGPVKVRELRMNDGVLQVRLDETAPAGTAQRAGGPSSPFQILTIRTNDVVGHSGGLLQAEVVP